MREEDLEAEAETGTGVETGVCDCREALWRWTTGSGSSVSSTNLELWVTAGRREYGMASRPRKSIWGAGLPGYPCCPIP